MEENTMSNKPYIKIIEDKVLKFNRNFIKVGEPYKMSFAVFATEGGRYSPPMWYFIQNIVFDEKRGEEVLVLIDSLGRETRVMAYMIENEHYKIIETPSFDYTKMVVSDLVLHEKDWTFDREWFEEDKLQPYYVYTKQDDVDVPWMRSLSFIDPDEIHGHTLSLSILVNPTIIGDNSTAASWASADIIIDNPDDIVIIRAGDYLGTCPPEEVIK
jgi:hypothetical protein